MKRLIVIIALSVSLHAQEVDTKPRNFSHGTAASKPGTCNIGDVYFASDATAGQNLYFCTASNTWTQQLNSGGGGGGSLGTTRLLWLPLSGYNTSIFAPLWGYLSFIGGDIRNGWAHTDWPTAGGYGIYTGMWPGDFDNTKTVGVKVWYSDISGGGGNFKLDFSMACIHANNTVDSGVAAPFNATLSSGSFGASSIYINNTTWTSLAVSGTSTCDLGDIFQFKASRDSTVGGNSGDALAVYGVALTYTAK